MIFGFLPDLSLVAATLRREVTDSSHGFTRPRWGGGARAPIQRWCRFRGLSHRCLTLCSTVSHPYGRTSGVRPFTSSRATSCAWCAPTERVHLYFENSFITCCPTFLPLSYIALFSLCFFSSFFTNFSKMMSTIDSGFDSGSSPELHATSLEDPPMSRTHQYRKVMYFYSKIQ